MKVQPPDSLPQSRAAALEVSKSTAAVSKKTPTPRGSELILDGGWKLAPAAPAMNGRTLSLPAADTHGWWNATVPGTVLGTLVDQGVYPTPEKGLNNLAIPETLSRQDYWYRTEFTLPSSFAGRELWLQFDGINYYAEVWLNGAYLGHITGAFARGEFRVTARARHGRNVLAVMVCPPPDPGQPSEQSMKFGAGDNGGRLCLDGPTFICSEGWDWIPGVRDRCTGLWQPVRLRATGPVVFGDPKVVATLSLPDAASAELLLEAEVRNVDCSVQEGVLRAAFERGTVQQRVRLAPGETKTVRFRPADYPVLKLAHPRLWWPNGYGQPELYHMQWSFVAADGRESDRRATRFGIREMSYELALKTPQGTPGRFEFRPTRADLSGGAVIDISRKAMGWDGRREGHVTPALGTAAQGSPALQALPPDGMGPFLVVKVNGRRILCRGGNWGMDDLLKRVSRSRLEPYVRLHRDAHLTMIRNWCGQSTSETFYDLCDEYGLLVWNDFWMSTEGWNYNPLDTDLFLANVADVVKRYRHHPSIALWCARNEGVPPEALNLGIDRLVRTLDGTRYYQPNSRDVNLRNSGPWSNLPLEKYYHEVNEGFTTELGASSIPSAEALRAMMAPADLWPPGDVWSYHDFHSKGAADRASTLERVTQRFGEPASLEDLCRKAQMVNYETYRGMYEGFNSRLWNSCSGVLLWMSHPSWPSVVWQLYTADYEPNAAYFGARKGSEPVHIQMSLPECSWAVINHTAAPLEQVTASATLYTVAGVPVKESRTTLTASANACTPLGRLDWPDEGAFLARLELRQKDGRLLADNFYWHARKESQLQALNALPQAALRTELRSRGGGSGGGLTLKVANPGTTPALAVHLTLRDARTGRRVLPVYYSDNFFSLLPGESALVTIDGVPAGATPQVDVDGWNVRPARVREGAAGFGKRL